MTRRLLLFVLLILGVALPSQTAPVQGPITLLNAQTATAFSVPFFVRGQCANATVMLQSNGTTSGGAVTIEEAYYDPTLTYTGTWSALVAVSASTFTGTAQSAVHVAGSVWAVRARISSTITGGGTVSAYAWCE